jgi:hypothetical protein
MTSTETLRAKQNMEILDVFKNINSQVNAITRRQVAVFPDTMKPKTQRDLEVEVNVDKSIESINRLLETKLSSLEFIIQSQDFQLDPFHMNELEDPRIRKSASQTQFTTLVNTGDIVQLWNGVVRYYQQVGLSKQSQEMVKVKVQDLDANLEAILYGLTQLIDALFQNRQFNMQLGLRLLELLRTKSIYQLISRQVSSSTFELVSVAVMDSSFQNIFAELSQERRELLETVSQRDNIGFTPIRKIPIFSTKNFDARLKAIADELGIDVSRIPPDAKERLRKMNQTDFEKFADNAIREVRSKAEQFTQNEQRVLQELESKIKELEKIVDVINEISRVRQNLEEEIDRLGVDEEIDESMLADVPELPIAPVRPNVLSGDAELDELAMNRYYVAKRIFKRLVALRQNIIERNEFLRERARAQSRADRDEMIAEKQQELRELDESGNRVIQVGEVIQEEIEQIQARIEEFGNTRLTQLGDSLVRLQEGYSLQETYGMGKPKNIGTRGLASMRHNYGIFDSSSESSEESGSESEDEDVFDFDDRRNEMYYTRPVKK